MQIAAPDHPFHAEHPRRGVKYGRSADGKVSYVDGADIAGLAYVADAMSEQGVV